MAPLLSRFQNILSFVQTKKGKNILAVRCEVGTLVEAEMIPPRLLRPRALSSSRPSP